LDIREHRNVPLVRQAHSLSTDNVNHAMLEAIALRGRHPVYNVTLELIVDWEHCHVSRVTQTLSPAQVPLNAVLVHPDLLHYQ
jgi:hypothetical protein